MKPLIPIATIEEAEGTPGKQGLLIHFTDKAGRQGAADFSPDAIAVMRSAISAMDGTKSTAGVPTVEVLTTTKAAMANGALGLKLGLSGGTNLLLQIPPAIFPALLLHLQELQAIANASQSLPKH